MSVPHTFNALLPGYEALEITIDVRLRQSDLDAMRRAGRPDTAIIDFPNWEIAAPVVGLTRDGSPEALPKPCLPLTWEQMTEWPSDLLYYLTGNQCLRDGLADYLRHAHPNLRAG